jgi:hypothetical protein
LPLSEIHPKSERGYRFESENILRYLWWLHQLHGNILWANKQNWQNKVCYCVTPTQGGCTILSSKKALNFRQNSPHQQAPRHPFMQYAPTRTEPQWRQQMWDTSKENVINLMCWWLALKDIHSLDHLVSESLVSSGLLTTKGKSHETPLPFCREAMVVGPANDGIQKKPSVRRPCTPHPIFAITFLSLSLEKLHV